MIFENSSPKGSFGPNMSDSPNWSLTANSRTLQAAALKCLKYSFQDLKAIVIPLNERKYMEHIFERRMKDQIEERSSQSLRNLSSCEKKA